MTFNQRLRLLWEAEPWTLTEHGRTIEFKDRHELMDALMTRWRSGTGAEKKRIERAIRDIHIGMKGTTLDD